jgi:hypothetical protein
VIKEFCVECILRKRIIKCVCSEISLKKMLTDVRNFQFLVCQMLHP